MRQASTRLTVSTRGKGLYDFTAAVRQWVGAQEIQSGLLTLFVQHTSASLIIQENADPDVVLDLKDFFERLVPETIRFRHTIEGPDDMPAHIRAALTAASLSIPVLAGQPALGTWQGIYLFEHRSSPNRRSVVLHILGE